MKTSALFCVLLCIVGAVPVAAQNGMQWDAATYYAEISAPVIADERVLTRSPLFDNAPFLQLRNGDQLVEGRLCRDRAKADAAHFESKKSVFLRSKGKLFNLDCEIANGRLNLREVPSIIFFDWDVSLENAARLRALSGFEGQPISLARFEIIRKALRAQFPEAVRDDSTPQISPPTLIGPKNARRVVSEGLVYNFYRRELSKFRFEIGSGVYRYIERPFLVGPPEVERADWDKNAALAASSHPNSRMYGPFDAATVARKRAAYNKMVAFDALMAKLLPPTKRS